MVRDFMINKKKGITITEEKIDQSIIDYFYKENLDRFIQKDDIPNIEYKYRYEPEANIVGLGIDEFPPEVLDLCRIHKLVRERNVFTVLEFGIGYSTLVIADAIQKNKIDSLNNNIEDIFWTDSFSVHSIDSSKAWADKFKKKLKKNESIEPYINLHLSNVRIGEFNGQICHYYDNLPDIIPDFIYLDGPSPLDVTGEIRGITFQNTNRSVMSGDLLIMEPSFHPGTFILVDGRSNNARFLKNNFKRNWQYNFAGRGYKPNYLDEPLFENWNDLDFTTFELVEYPINYWNYKKLKYCLSNIEGYTERTDVK